MKYIAHTNNAEEVQSLLDHLQGTAQKCRTFAEAFHAGALGEVAGLYHDIGKYSQGFYKRIMKKVGKVDHSTAGAIETAKIYSDFGLLLALCIAGHHGGLPNVGTPVSKAGDGTLLGRLKKDLSGDLDYSAYKNEVIKPDTELQIPQWDILPDQKYSAAFFIRMLFSCLVDADFLDTEAFCDADKQDLRTGFASIEELDRRLSAHLAKFSKPVSEINKKRTQILNECLQKAEAEPGLFSLTVPTGGGKTLSSLAFALKHAQKYGKQRVIYVIPYTSIIEQTADVFRDILNINKDENNVIEHHMNVNYDRTNTENEIDIEIDEQKRKLAAENWDAPVIVTTNVQFFESLYGNRTSKCRKLHNIVNSVIVFDEAQMLPNDYLQPCIRAIAELVAYYKVSAVLCTATQPSLNKLFPDNFKINEICSDVQGLYNFFKRASYEQVEFKDENLLAQKLNEEKQVLCITNSRKEAQNIFDGLQGDKNESVFHLSTCMYPAHRREVLGKIRSCLKTGEPCKVVTTSLIEAGVDVDFPVVYREMAGLDNIIQAAGRCNREGRLAPERGKVFVYNLAEADYGKLPAFVKLPKSITEMIMQDFEDMASVEAIKEYFDRLHYIKGSGLDTKEILNKIIKEPFMFKEIAEKFVLIEENTRTIFVNRNEESEKLAGVLRSGVRTRELLRQASQYTVQVYEDQFQKMLAAGKVEALDPEQQVNILLDKAMYDDAKGLFLDLESGQGISL
ncbi:MAG: CRISPR-associated helicase Cas3' [Phascolarctobacterium sp.]|uniref:CRISPR-associated helicase Cas3' n=1 Tax=Phascolarctobacterium sp. TaxID=2049039 RepID=UPI0025E08BE1|nr:CRISPR-associated helicase Cas3' [Phascolarctobacterium sp.]MCC8159105.1 CRISPR-associated helicase Cas3' [Phascolarctobacterium sp.]